jgi:hypothetical protein
MIAIRPAALAVGLAVLFALNGCGNNAVARQAAEDTAPTGVQRTYPTQQKQACDILTEQIAKKLLGSVGDESAPVPATGSTTVQISSCVRASSLADLDDTGAVSLVIRVAQSSAGAQTNEDAFARTSMPKAGKVVDGYGEKAFWNPTVGQLNILKDGNWYVLAAGPIDPSRHTLAETVKLADAIVDDL